MAWVVELNTRVGRIIKFYAMKSAVDFGIPHGYKEIHNVGGELNRWLLCLGMVY